MIRTPVVSSNLASVGYDERARVLEIEFHGSRTYEYLDVPADYYTALLNAGSKGRFVARFIKGRFRYRHVF
jgi:hypothetical protein